MPLPIESIVPDAMQIAETFAKWVQSHPKEFGQYATGAVGLLLFIGAAGPRVLHALTYDGSAFRDVKGRTIPTAGIIRR